MKRQAGFTLLEVLVATALLGLAVVTLLGLHARNLALAADIERTTRATLLASRVLAETRAAPYPDLGITDGEFTDDIDDHDGERRFYGGPDSGQWRWRREVSDPELRIGSIRYVTVEVRGVDDDRNAPPAATLWTALRRDTSGIPRP